MRPILLVTLGALLFLGALARVNAQDSPLPVALGPDRGWIDALAISPQFDQDGRAWAATYGSKIYATQDSAATWHPSRQGETDPVVTSLAASSNFGSDRTVYAAADDGVFRSQDGGATWSPATRGLNGRPCRVLVLSASFATDRSAWVATDQGVYRSIDGGDNWSPPSTGAEAIGSLAVVGSGPTLFAGSAYGGLLRSDDAGQHWSAVASFPSGRQALSIAAINGRSGRPTVVVGTDAGIVTSNDGGQSFGPPALPTDRIPTVDISPAVASDPVVFAGSASGRGIYQSTDGGSSWHASGLAGQFATSIAASPTYAVDGTVFVGTAGHGVYLSHDRGATWQAENAKLNAARVSAVQTDPRGVVEAGIGGTSRQPAQAHTWADLPVGSDLVLSYAESGLDAYAGTVGRGVRLSHDGGSTWQSSGLYGGTVSAVAVSPIYDSDGTVIAADSQVFLSTNRGLRWQQASGIIGNDVSRIRFSPTFATDHAVFAATLLHGVMRSTDGGAHWTSASGGLPLGQIDDVLPSPTFASDHTVYAASAGTGIYVSRDAGDTWNSLAAQPASLLVTVLSWGRGSDLLAGTNRGLFERVSGAWSPLGGTWDGYVTDLALDTTASTVYIGTLGDGVWSLGLAPQANPTPTRTVPPLPSPTASPKGLHLQLAVYPSPLESGRPALIVARGTSHARLRLSLTATRWHRSYVGVLDARGHAGFGFVAPASTLTVSGTLTAGNQTTTVRVKARVKGLP